MNPPPPSRHRLIAVLARGRHRQLAGLGLLLLVSSALPLAGPQLLRLFIDSAALRQPLSLLALIAAGFLAVSLIQQALAVVVAYASTHLAWVATNALRAEVARHTFELDLTFHDGHSPGELIERTDGDVTALSSFVSSFVVQVAGSVLTLLGVLVVVALEDWRLGLGILGFVVVAATTIWRLRNFSVPQATERRAASATLFGEIEERLAGAEDLRANSGGAYAVRRFQHTLAYLMRASLRSVGDLALFVSYLAALVWVPHYTGRLLAKHRQAGVSVDRMATLLPAPDALVVHRPLRASDPPPAPGHDRLARLTVCGLTAVHPTSGRGVRDVSLTLERGTFTVVTGPAGAGKTSLLRAILGLLPAQAGAVYWNDVAVADRAEFLASPRSAYVPQVPRLFSESLRDNVLLGNADTSGLRAALRTAVLDRDVASMPAGLDTQVGARGVRLSGGQVQRAAIARALVRRADLLVLDDVSSALDVETERRLWDQLLADRSRTLLVVSNRPATIARADQIIRLDQGRSQLAPTAMCAA